ncbi:MAG: hypothetical protein P8047_15190, partial [Gammaproteobacteria bacterium]
ESIVFIKKLRSRQVNQDEDTVDVTKAGQCPAFCCNKENNALKHAGLARRERSFLMNTMLSVKPLCSMCISRNVINNGVVP